MHSLIDDLLINFIELTSLKAVVDVADRVAEALLDLFFVGLVLELSHGILVIHQGLEWRLIVQTLLHIFGIFVTKSKQDFILQGLGIRDRLLVNIPDQ